VKNYLFLNNNKQTIIVIFLGPVGVGKSTQMILLKRYFQSKKNRTVSTYINSNHLFAYILQKLLILVGCSENSFYPDGTYIARPNRCVMYKLIPLSSFLDTVSIALKFFVNVFVPFRLGFNVLIEEGPAMTLHTYSKYYPYYFKTNPLIVRFSEFLLAWVSKEKHIQIVFDATDDELDERRKNREFRKIESSEHVNSQRKWLQGMNFQGTIHVETRSKSIFEVRTEVINIFERN
jgi:hypothetical protein